MLPTYIGLYVSSCCNLSNKHDLKMSNGRPVFFYISFDFEMNDIEPFKMAPRLLVGKRRRKQYFPRVYIYLVTPYLY